MDSSSTTAWRTALPTWGQLLRRSMARSPATSQRAPARCEEPAPTPVDAPPAAETPSTENPFAAPEAKSEPVSSFEMFSREWSQMSQQDNFDGFRIEAATQVTKYLQASHTLFLGTQLRECGYIYQFGPVFQTEGQRTVMVARAGLDGGVNGRVIQKIGDRFELKVSSQTHLKDAQRCMHDASVDYTGKDWTGGVKFMYQGVPMFGGSFTQRLIQQLHLGGDITLIPVNGLMTIGTLGFRWAEGKDVLTAAVNRQPNPRSPVGASLSEGRLQYVRKVSERLSLGAEYKFSHPDQESGLSMAYEYMFRNARVQGLLDTDGRVSCCVSDYQGMGMSGVIDYVRGEYKFGVLMHVMPPEAGAPGA